MFRKTIFWIHLVSGLISGIVIAIMSITGIAIAFEEEILAWVDREVSHVDVPDETTPLSIEQLLAIVREKRPDHASEYLRVHSDPTAACQFLVGYEDPLYVNPYTGEITDTRAHTAHEIIHKLEMWHRFFGLDSEDTWIIGRHINGAANLAFLLLCLTGIYLWFPRALKLRLFKKGLTFNKKATGKARDFNWHNVFGIWSLPGLVILAATAVVISYEWGHKIPFLLNGEEATKSRTFGMMAVPPAVVPTPPDGSTPLPYEQILASTKEMFPDWVSIGFSTTANEGSAPTSKPILLNLTRPDHMPSRAWTPVEVDPYTGKMLQFTRFQDRSAGLRARVWTRFLHTGAGFGFWGKSVACLFTLGSLFLVYTGFALSWRRFVR
ncbi:PepSY-associated TM helix domain-containing protein [Pelagicoccus sp. SDUM812002]|uniref:PepSY-associated TM helix domain-containing protein n=1 Tax=Pelagicoccus sp. SDUM812002 TaxID=3041266 RepID=UPI0028102F82|nr:PepSY-associated TM helix domain-containing protein [Pelagicoccus sp. SDUM812002]MDQ8184829.1 PepSY-associated TM helix domain-containing protein [Pelagicoccus sp. SDUM812002]